MIDRTRLTYDRLVEMMGLSEPFPNPNNTKEEEEWGENKPHTEHTRSSLYDDIDAEL